MGRSNKLTMNTKNNLAIVASNNHYASFGPVTANIFRKMFPL
jgi:phage gpG-like protein